MAAFPLAAVMMALMLTEVGVKAARSCCVSTGTRAEQACSLGMLANVHWEQAVDSKVAKGKLGACGAGAEVSFETDGVAGEVVGAEGVVWAVVEMAMVARARMRDVQRIFFRVDMGVIIESGRELEVGKKVDQRLASKAVELKKKEKERKRVQVE
jgi:hypothetical protein